MKTLERIFVEPWLPRFVVGEKNTQRQPRIAIGSVDSATLTGKETFSKGNLDINVFQTAAQLDTAVVNSLSREIEKPGLVILPADSTHGDEAGKPSGNIYYELNERIGNGSVTPHEGLKLTHMDEIDLGTKRLESEGFAHSLKTWLRNLTDQLGDRFQSLDPQDLDAYNKFIDAAGGPRVIVGGVGAGVPPHIAYIGEEELEGSPVINMKTKLIKLRPDEAQRRRVAHAATMGMDEFKKDSLDLVIMNAKGERKADSIKFAFEEALSPDGSPASAFGMLLKYFASGKNPSDSKLVVNIDAEAAKKSRRILSQLS